MVPYSLRKRYSLVPQTSTDVQGAISATSPGRPRPAAAVGIVTLCFDFDANQANGLVLATLGVTYFRSAVQRSTLIDTLVPALKEARTQIEHSIEALSPQTTTTGVPTDTRL